MTSNRILTHHNKVEEAFVKYTNALTKTNERRELWRTETKNKIIDVLTLVQNTFKLAWHVQRLEKVENYQTINISCNSTSSGIVETKIDNTTGKPANIKSFIKHGGYLAFCQSYNGKVNIIIGYPYIDEWVSQMDVKVIATLEPSEITEEIISNQVIIFLGIMAEWEGMDRLPVGFKI